MCTGRSMEDIYGGYQWKTQNIHYSVRGLNLMCSSPTISATYFSRGSEAAVCQSLNLAPTAPPSLGKFADRTGTRAAILRPDSAGLGKAYGISVSKIILKSIPERR